MPTDNRRQKDKFFISVNIRSALLQTLAKPKSVELISFINLKVVANPNQINDANTPHSNRL